MVRAPLARTLRAIATTSSFVLSERHGVRHVIGACALRYGPTVLATRLGLLEVVRELEFRLRQDDVLEVAMHGFRMVLLAHEIVGVQSASPVASRSEMRSAALAVLS